MEVEENQEYSFIAAIMFFSNRKHHRQSQNKILLPRRRRSSSPSSSSSRPTTNKLQRVFYYIVALLIMYFSFSMIIEWTMVLNNGHDISTIIENYYVYSNPIAKKKKSSNINYFNRFYQNLIPFRDLMTMINNNTDTHEEDLLSWKHDFGNLRFTYRDDLESPIIINPKNDYIQYEVSRTELLDTMDHSKTRFNIDYMPPSERQEYEVETDQDCHAQSWTTKSYPNCNQIHELVIERPTTTIDEDEDYDDVAEQQQQHLLQDYDVSYLSSGYYRDAWRMLRKMPSSSSKPIKTKRSSSSSNFLRTTTTDDDEEVVLDHFVLKKMKFHDRRTKYDSRDFSKIHKEAIIMERLSKSEMVLDIYGYCGVSVQVEAMAGDLWKKIIMQELPEQLLLDEPDKEEIATYTNDGFKIRIGPGFISQEMLDQLYNMTSSSSNNKNPAKNPLRQNNFTTSEILQISLDMAVSLEDLHTNQGDGPIIHADVHIEQWLIGMDGTTKLNDFGDADIMKYNSHNNTWCEVTSGKHSEVYRSPEEFVLTAMEDQSKDVYSFANNVYTLLTGLWPFYDGQFKGRDNHDMQDELILGKRPYIDPKFRHSTSYIERKLVELMERCWKYRRNERPPAHDVVKFLREVKRNAIESGELQPSDLINIPMEIVS